MPSAPTIVSSVVSTGSGYSLATYYRRLASELGFYQAASTTAEAAVGDTTRVILAEELRDDEAEYRYMARPWVYITDLEAAGSLAGVQRRILSNRSGHLGPLGGLLVSRPYASPVPSGTLVEVTRPLPIRSHLSVKGLITCVNEALGDIWIPVRLAFTGNATNSYDLADSAAYGAILTYNQTRGIWDTRELGTSMPATRSPWGLTLLIDGADRSILTDSRYNTSESFFIDAIVRANDYIFDGAVWNYVATNGTKGLQSRGQRAAAPEDWVLAFSMHKALDHLIEILVNDDEIDEKRRDLLLRRLEQRKRTWGIACCNMMIDEFPKPLHERTESMIAGTTVDSGWTGAFIEPAREVPLVGT